MQHCQWSAKHCYIYSKPELKELEHSKIGEIIMNETDPECECNVDLRSEKVDREISHS
jgi:hypothetical protein